MDDKVEEILSQRQAEAIQEVIKQLGKYEVPLDQAYVFVDFYLENGFVVEALNHESAPRRFKESISGKIDGYIPYIYDREYRNTHQIWDLRIFPFEIITRIYSTSEALIDPQPSSYQNDFPVVMRDGVVFRRLPDLNVPFTPENQAKWNQFLVWLEKRKATQRSLLPESSSP